MTASEFKALFPQFTSESDARVLIFMGLAAPHFDVTRWGDFYSEGLANWVAHSIVVANAEATASTSVIDADDATTETFSRISTTRSPELAKMSATDPFMRTTYGRRYAYLRRMVGLGGVVVHSGSCVSSAVESECACVDGD